MKFILTKDYDMLSTQAADLVIEQIKKKSSSVLGLATGSTPIGMYKKLVNSYHNGLDFSSIITFNLDEYVGLSPDHPQSYRYFMDVNLFNHVNINKKNIHVPSGVCDNVKEFCLKYDNAIKEAGGIDLQILGIGRNGHIGFNEPAEVLEGGTHMTKLSTDTIDANSRFFDSIEDVPKAAITMGISTIMKSRKIVLLASGPDKAPVIAKISKPYIDTKVPASLLHLHSNAVIIVDRGAASMLDLSEIDYTEI